MNRRRQRSPLAFVGFVVAAGIAHPLAVVTYDAAYPPDPIPPPVLTLMFMGTGAGSVRIDGTNLACTGTCDQEVKPGQRVTIVAEPGTGSYIDGWSNQCTEGEPFTQCTLDVEHSRKLAIFFEKVPEDVEFETVVIETDDADDEIELPDPELELAKLEMPTPPAVLIPEPELPMLQPPPAPAPVPPPLQPPPPPPPEEPPPEEPAPPPELPKASGMKSVEVADDKSVVEEAPDDAAYLSDKNRDVTEQTRARDTNLESEQQGKGTYSEQSDIKSNESGAAEDDIAQLEDSEETDLEAEREQETSHSGDEQVARGIRLGDDGGGGDDGDGGDGGDAKKEQGVLAMRGITGRGTPGGPSLPAMDDAKNGIGGKRGRRGKKGKKGVKTQLEFDDYERIVGTDRADEEVEVARRRRSKRKGKWTRKIARVNSSLENFVGEVEPGNQTALKTRAAPFALFVNRMHRKIHELWGFGFIADLDGLGPNNELNNWELWTKIEVVVDRDGFVDKATVVRPSGVTRFDVAALDVVFSAEPYDKPPQEILSKNGKAYLHWRFHRDHEQCGTFGVETFILDNAPTGSDEPVSEADGKLFGDPRGDRRERTPRAVGAQSAGAPTQGAEGAAARATANLPTPDDPRAQQAALAWMSGFEQGQLSEMVRVSSVPFVSGGKVVANDSGGVAAVYGTIISETPRRRVLDWKVMSPAGYRKLYGAVPLGHGDTTSKLLLVLKLKDDRLTLVLQQQGDGAYRVVGFHR